MEHNSGSNRASNRTLTQTGRLERSGRQNDEKKARKIGKAQSRATFFSSFCRPEFSSRPVLRKGPVQSSWRSRVFTRAFFPATQSSLRQLSNLPSVLALHFHSQTWRMCFFRLLKFLFAQNDEICR